MKGFINRSDLVVMAEKAVAYWQQVVEEDQEDTIRIGMQKYRRTFPFFGRKIFFTEQEVRAACESYPGLDHPLIYVSVWYDNAKGSSSLERAEQLLASAQRALPRRYILDEKDLKVLRVVLDKA